MLINKTKNIHFNNNSANISKFFLDKKFCLLLFTFFYFAGFSQDFKNISLLDHWFSDTIITNSTEARFNDCWGFKSNGKEYAALGSTEGIHIFEIGENDKLIFRDFQKGTYSATNVVHRDFKIYKNYLYAVCDEGTSALQIYDTSTLPDSLTLVAEINAGFGRIHNIFIDTSSALLLACDVKDYTMGSVSPMRIYNILNPINPLLLFSGPSDVNVVHDAFARDGKIILNCGFDGLRTYDVSNPSTPQLIQTIDIYQDQGYNHQGWLSPDGTTYIFADETNGKKIKKVTVNENYQMNIISMFGTNIENQSVPHNIMLSDKFAYVAYYNEGLRIYDYTYKTPVEVAYYDTYPTDHPFKMNGAWGVYSAFFSKRIIVSDRQNGLFLFQFDEDEYTRNEKEEKLSIYPNPLISNNNLTVKLNEKFVDKIEVEIYDYTGKAVGIFSNYNFNYIQIPIDLNVGIYQLKVRYNTSTEEFLEIGKVLVY